MRIGAPSKINRRKGCLHITCTLYISTQIFYFGEGETVARVFENGDVLQWVGTAEQAFVALGGVPKYVDPKTFFDTSVFIEASRAGS